MLLISEDLDEVMTLVRSDRVMYEGAIVGEVDARTATVEEIGLLMAGVQGDRMSLPRGADREAPAAAAVADGRGSARFARRGAHRDRDPARRHGACAVTTFRRLFDAGYLADGALSNTLIAATPLAFTGLAAAVAFRMRLFNIGAEGQLYFGAIGAAGMAMLLAGRRRRC